ncbi:MAG: DUF1552 domain-containing protein [Pirellulaceae bacterium]|nr:DUF1552 domain-containing protein [Planctomycetales bacterium]
MSHSSPTRYTRRRFLRSAQAMLALPFLPSLSRGTVHGAEGTPPLRNAFIYFPNGVWERGWKPEQTGADYQLSPSLEPLEAIRSKVLVLSGLDKKHSHGGDGHYAKTANFLTGMPVAKTTGKDISSGGISVDQLIAQHLAGQTPLPSLELGTEPVISGVDSNVGYTRLYGSHISWQTPSRPVAKEINPRVVYERLFGRKVTDDQRRAESYRNLLDFVLDDAAAVRQRLGRDDQFKLDEYLDSVRAVEMQIEYATRQDPREWEPNVAPEVVAAHEPGVPGDFREHIDIMLNLMVLAFQTDSTRVCSLMFANDVSGRNFSFLEGVNNSHHELSHHENNEAKIQQYQLINRWHTEVFARFLERLDQVQEGEGTLLDHSLVMFGSSISDGNRHDPDNLPILLGGGGGGTVASGRHLAWDQQTPLCNLYLALLRRNGVDVERFGDSEEELAIG